MKNPPSGGFFIAAAFPNTNKKARHQTGFFILWLKRQAA